jgi:cation transport regulator ChaC
LGLDRGGSCRGIAYRLAPDSLAEEIDRLWVREMTGEVYRMTRLAVTTAEGSVAGYAFTVRRDSRDYAGRLEPEAAAVQRTVANAKLLEMAHRIGEVVPAGAAVATRGGDDLRIEALVARGST